MAVVTRVWPAEILSDGGTDISVDGSGFTGASKVYFRDPNGTEYPLKSFTIVNDGLITGVTPNVNGRGDRDLFVVVNGKDSMRESMTINKNDGSGGVTPTSIEDYAHRVRAVVSYTMISDPFADIGGGGRISAEGGAVFSGSSRSKPS